MLLLVLVRDRNTWTLLDRKRQYSKSKCLFLCILPNMSNDLIGGYLIFYLNQPIKWTDFRLDALLTDRA
jgi:hypothetical protein